MTTDISVDTVLKIICQSNSDEIASIEIVTGGGQPGGSVTAQFNPEKTTRLRSNLRDGWSVYGYFSLAEFSKEKISL